MSHPIHRVVAFEQTGQYVLRVEFDDGVCRTIDFKPVLHGELYGPLRNPAVFAQVRLDPEVHTLIWPSGADFDPATLHDWLEHEAAFRAAAERWSNAHSTPDSQDGPETLNTRPLSAHLLRVCRDSHPRGR